jgi:hypothetical protein
VDEDFLVPAKILALALLVPSCFLDRESQPPDDPCVAGGQTQCPDSSGTRMFVTAEAYGSNLAELGEAADGLTGADNLCALRARIAGLGGSWKAWLSSSTVDALDRIHGNGPWYQRSNKVAFSSRENLRTEPRVWLLDDEFGESAGYNFWTATRHGGLRSATGTCGDWTGALQGTALTGSPTLAGTHWTEDYAIACSGRSRLLCIED